jgi:hypothetical protein
LSLHFFIIKICHAHFEAARSITTNDYPWGKGAHYDDTGTPGFQYIYNKNQTPTSNRPPEIPLESWFFSVNSGDEIHCVGVSGFSNFSETERNIANGTLAGTSEANTWDLRRMLWYKMSKHPEEISTNPDLQTFYTHTFGSSEQQYGAALYQFEQAFTSPNSMVTELNIDYTSLSTLKEQIIQLSARIGLDTINVDSTKIDSLSLLWRQHATLNQSISTLLDSYTSQKNNNLQSFQSLVNGLPSTNPYESSWISIFNAGIKRGQGIDLDPTERNQLISIANTCAPIVGYASRSVIAFMPAEDSQLFADWENNVVCDRSDESQPLNKVVSTIGLYPNPASDNITISVPWSDGGTWMITSIEGKSISNGELGIGQITTIINIPNTHSGVYLFQANRTNGERHVVKFTIVSVCP